MEVIQMETIDNKEIVDPEGKTPGKPPAFKTDGCAVWLNKDKNGQQYLSIQLLGKFGIKLNVFRYTPKEKK